VERMEQEIKMAERKYSHNSHNNSSSSSSSSSSAPSVLEVRMQQMFTSHLVQDDRVRDAPGIPSFSSPAPHTPNLNRFSFDLSSPSLDEEMESIETEVHSCVVVPESPLSQRRASNSSESSSFSSSSSNSPSKTIAEVDLSIPLSQQIVSELQSGDFRYGANYFSHITSDLQGKNRSYIYEIEEELEAFSAESTEEEQGQANPIGSPLIKQATPVTWHSDEWSTSSSEQENDTMSEVAPAQPLALEPPPPRDRILSDITETSETRRSSSSSSSASSAVLHSDPRLDALRGEPVRRNSSGITSAPTSVMRMRLSTDYESVYSKVEEAKKRSRDETYKKVKLNLHSLEDSAA